MRKLFILSLFSIITTLTIKAQDGVEGLFFANIEDTQRLSKEYINPVMDGLIYGMNNGWYHTAKVHKKFGFDITLGASGSIIPSKNEIFTLNNLTSINQPTGTISSATIAGSKDDGSTATVTFQENGVTFTGAFDLPGGIKEDLPINAVPTPAIQASLGLPFKSEVILRYVPRTGSNDVKASLFGVGLKKEITDWFGPLGKTPLHVSILAAYSTLGADYLIEDEDPNDAIEIENGNVDFSLNAYTIQAIASLNFPIINIYGGVGYNGGTSSLKVLGKYTVTYNATLNQRTLQNPLDLDFDANGFNATLGARLSLGFFKLFGSYTLQDYNTINAGIAFSFR